VSGLVALGVKDIALRHLAVRDMPASGKPAELIEAAGLGARDVAAAVRALLA
jgi:transketolase